MALTESTAILKIDSLAYGPYGIGRKGRQVILAPLTAPGDEVKVRIVEEKSNYAIGKLSQLIKHSPVRRNPPCSYVGTCGGCPWQHIEYEAQLAAKEKNIEDALRRIGKLDGFELLPILRSPQEYHYRRRIRLQADSRKRLGFHRAFSHELIEIDSCLIAEQQADRHLSDAREWVRELRTHVQHIEIVVDEEENAVLLVGKVEGSFSFEDDDACSRFLAQRKEIKGLILFGRGWRRSWGEASAP
jgi:23S rRNA (uracil1939-C5)-methyltransferase